MLIAHALISRPRLLLLDEPLANLDIGSEQDVVALLGRVAREQQIAVLISAHDMNPLLPFMDRIVYMAAGRAASGTTAEVVRPEVLSSLYGQHVDVIRVHDRILVVAGRAGLAAAEAAPVRRPAPRAHRAAPSSPRRGRVVLNAIFEPGFFSSGPVHVALAAGGVVALVSGIVGSFTVIRGQSYAGHALADISVTGGSASFLVGVSPLWGFVGVGVLAAGVMDMIGIQRPRGRDLATGIVRGAGLGLAALFLYWDTTHSNVTGATITILFGSLFTISSSILPAIVALSVAAVAIVAVLYRPLLLSTVAADLAAARGVQRAAGRPGVPGVDRRWRSRCPR